MTEDEAKTKWCPHSRVLDYRTNPFGAAAASYNRKTNGKANCVGSNCMMWRGGISFGFRDGVEFSEKTGYCGLAGKP